MFTMPQEWAETYFANRLYSSAWQEADSTDKPKALAMATNMVTSCFSFMEDAFFVNEDDEDDCVDAIKRGICEQAIHLLKMDPTEYPELLTMGIASAGASGASATFDRDMIAPYICRATKQMIGEYGEYLDSENGNSKVASYPLRW